jgi:hypothetical protein
VVARGLRAGPPQCLGSRAGGTLGLFALVEGVGVGIVGVGQLGGLGQRVGQRPQRSLRRLRIKAGFLAGRSVPRPEE